MIFFSDRKKIVDAYEQWLKNNPEVKDCAFNVVSFMVGKGLVKNRSETDFYDDKPIKSKRKYDEIVNEDDFYIDWDYNKGYLEATHIPTGKKKRVNLNWNNDYIKVAKSLSYWMMVHLNEL